MADQIIVTGSSSSQFAPHPEGQMAGVCVDVVDLGERLRQWSNKPKVAHQCAIVFVTGERREGDGQLFDLSAEFTVSFFDRANLRLFLEAWRGRTYTEEEAEKGVPLHKLVGKPALLSIEHQVSQKGRKYARIKSIMPLPKGLPKPDVNPAEYKRAEYWEERKEGYRTELANFRKSHAPAPADNFEDFPSGTSDDADLPF